MKKILKPLTIVFSILFIVSIIIMVWFNPDTSIIEKIATTFGILLVTSLISYILYEVTTTAS